MIILLLLVSLSQATTFPDEDNKDYRPPVTYSDPVTLDQSDNELQKMMDDREMAESQFVHDKMENEYGSNNEDDLERDWKACDMVGADCK